MNARKKLRELLARPGLTLMPGAYDAMSARIIEAQGFEAVGAGGEGAGGNTLAQPGTRQSNKPDCSGHCARTCPGAGLPGFLAGATGLGGVNRGRPSVRGV